MLKRYEQKLKEVFNRLQIFSVDKKIFPQVRPCGMSVLQGKYNQPGQLFSSKYICCVLSQPLSMNQNEVIPLP